MPQLENQTLQQIVRQKKFYKPPFEFGEYTEISMDPIKAAFENSTTFAKTLENHSFKVSTNLMNLRINKSDIFHCDNGPAYVSFLNGSVLQEKIDRFDYSYRKNGKNHNDNGLPADYISNYHYDEEKNKYFYTVTDIYKDFDLLHRENGPAYIKRHMDLLTGKIHVDEEDFCAFNNKYSEDEFKHLHLSSKELKDIKELEEKKESILDDYSDDFFNWPDDLPVLPKELINKFDLSQSKHSLSRLPIVYQKNHKRKLIKYGYISLDGGFIGHNTSDELAEIRIVGNANDVKVIVKYMHRGSLHRKNNSALIVYKTSADDKLLKNGFFLKDEYYQNGINHRENGPAITHRFYSGNLKLHEYRRHDLLHRVDGAARIKYWDNECNSIKMKEFYYLGQLHNLDGPAYIKYHPDGTIKEEKWYIYSNEINEKFLEDYGVILIEKFYADLGYRIPPALISYMETFDYYVGEPDKLQKDDQNLL